MPPADPTPPADDFPAGQTGDMRNVLLSPPTGPKTPAGRWEPPSAQELAAMLPQYEIESMLGRGGMGAVYKGTQIALDRPVAIKILSNQLEDADASFAERFKNEAKAMAKLSHPGIVGVYDFGETAGGLLYIVMEFIEGTDVAKMLTQQKRLHTEHAMAITAHVCDALAYAHERGIIHRDIKPANIMVGYDGVVKVADFGLAKMTHSQNSGLTQSGMAMGTLHYMAPEALMLGAGVDHRADIYAVGVMLYQMLTGKIPQGLFELPSLQVPGLDPRYDGIIGKALREDRELRYPRVLDMRHDLDAILTQPVVKVEAAAEKAPAALETQARPQRPSGQPYRPPQPELIVRTEKKSSPLLWVGFIAMACLAGWMVLNKDSGKGSEKLLDAAVSAAPVPAPVSNKQVTAGGPTASTTNPAEATKDRPFVNSLGMKFVPVPGTKVLFCIHETRKGDYAMYAVENPRANSNWRNVTTPVGPLVQTDAHPVVNINWNDAVTFCEWLGKNEERNYRLPTDQEWSFAVGLGEIEPNDSSPAKLHKLNVGAYPWGRQWPPPDRVGNYDDLSNAERHGRQAGIPGYTDGFGGSAPVMSFPPNKLGIHDMGGNVWEWCDDLMEPSSTLRVARGSSWTSGSGSRELKSSIRDGKAPSFQFMDHGFRCVLEVVNQLNLTTKAPVVPTPPQPSPSTISTVQTSPSTVDDPPNTTKTITDLLSLVDLTRDAVNGVWSKTVGGLRVEVQNQSRNPAQVQFPYPIKTVEYDYTVEFSFAADNAREMRQSFPAAGKSLNWSMQVFPNRPPVHFSFTRLDGVAPAFAKDAFTIRPLLAATSRHRSVIKVRGNSLTAEIDGETFVHWQGDLRRFGEDRQLRVPGSTDFQVFDGGIIIHKATITEFVPQPATTALPTGPTTWTDTKERTITATFKAIASGNVLLDIAGKVTPVPLNTLSAESQKLARDYHEQSSATAAKDRLAKATKDRPFVNSLGMKFVPVPGTKVLFCTHETRNQDYAAHAASNPTVNGKWRGAKHDSGLPVAFVNWHEATSFCEWLTQKEGVKHRLPTDREWSFAIGIGSLEDSQSSPESLSKFHQDVYPWGNTWPPPNNSGNFWDAKINDLSAKASVQASFADGFNARSPVMSFPANSLGIHDLAGNVLEWCEDWYNPQKSKKVLRGISIVTGMMGLGDFSSSRRRSASPESREDRFPEFGFRCVVELPVSAASAISPAVIPTAPPATSSPMPSRTSLSAATPALAMKDTPFVNSLGMKFVPVPGTKVLFCIHETRRQDYAAYAQAVPGVDESWKNQVREGVPCGHELTHPVVGVGLNDSQAFCTWISQKEGLPYRLPKDAEWSHAVGIAPAEAAWQSSTPEGLNGKILNVFPWDGNYPPYSEDMVGNYADLAWKQQFPKEEHIEQYTDGFATTAPVMSFKPNRLGLYDLGGNAWEFVSDSWNSTSKEPALRGASFHISSGRASLLSSARSRDTWGNRRHYDYGFRCVIELPPP
jgi:formylglycine-generating enzyme required for sulfatase activity/serine/threonine protein kinase